MRIYDFEQRGKTPLYEYLYKCIREDIISGILSADEKLPSRRAMAASYGISVITVENAYAELLTEGYIYTLPKRGYFVSRIERGAEHTEKATEIATGENPGESPETRLEKSPGTEKGKDPGGSLERSVEAKLESTPERSPETEPESKSLTIDLSSSHIAYDCFPFSTWAKLLRRTILDSEQSFLESPDPIGVRKLREAIAAHLMETHGMRVDSDCIVVGAGMEYLYGLVVQLLGRYRMIAVEDPGYPKVARVYEENGVRLIHIPVDEQGFSVKALERNTVSAIHISPSHHFPTGIVMPAARRHEILAWAAEHECYVIEDDYDSELRYSGHPIPPMASLTPERVIYMNTFSRTLAPSLRVAYMVLPKELMEKFRKKLGFYSSTVSGFEQYTLAAFLSEGYYERHVNRMRHYYREKRSRILQIISNSSAYISGRLDVEEKNAGLHFLISLEGVEDDAAFANELLGQGVRIRPVEQYMTHANSRFTHRFIVNYASLKEEDLAKALEIIEKAALDSNKFI